MESTLPSGSFTETIRYTRCGSYAPTSAAYAPPMPLFNGREKPSVIRQPFFGFGHRAFDVHDCGSRYLFDVAETLVSLYGGA